jgi:hypothetical protein
VVARFGLYTPLGPNNTAEYDAAVLDAGRVPSVLMWYRNFTNSADDTLSLNNARARGAIPLITFEPWAGGGAEQPTYSLAAINAGNFDAQFTAWANGLRAWGHEVWWRFAHEMNGNWYPWAASVNGNSAAAYVTAWRRVHGIFAAAGATNVKHIWSPNVAYSGSTPLADVWPGAQYVDKTAMDGYNWGDQLGHVWEAPAVLFDATLAQLRTIAPTKPRWIAETACTENGGSKSAWIGQFFTYLRNRPDLEGFVWFNENKEQDWRINSSQTSLDAFKAGTADALTFPADSSAVVSVAAPAGSSSSTATVTVTAPVSPASSRATVVVTAAPVEPSAASSTATVVVTAPSGPPATGGFYRFVSGAWRLTDLYRDEGGTMRPVLVQPAQAPIFPGD